jgi:hypothetical protein
MTFSVWRHHCTGHFGCGWPKCDIIVAQSSRTTGHAGRVGYICVPAKLVLALNDAFHFAGISAHLPDWTQQGIEGHFK